MKNCLSFLSFALVFSLCIYACKKKKSDQPATPTVYQGVFTSAMSAAGNGTSLTTYTNAINNGFISSVALDHYTWNPTSLVDVGNLSLNGVIFDKHISVPFYYMDTTTNIYSPPHVWSVTGAGNISAFTFTDTNTYPVFNGYSSLPDSFQISSGATIPINNYNNADEIDVFFLKATGKSTSNKYFPGNVSSIQFTASELSAIGLGKDNTLNITFYKNNNQVINGNNYVFRTAYSVRKSEIKFQ